MRPHHLTRASLLAATAFAFAALPGLVHADLNVRFSEGAPKDRFTLENTSTCALEDTAIVLDLSTSPAGLIFDVTAQGSGVEVFQPFQMVEGAQALKSEPVVTDGQSQITLDVGLLAPGQAIAFTIDVDDTLGQRAITVSGSEIAGATVSFAKADVSGTATFSKQAQASLALAPCPSDT